MSSPGPPRNRRIDGKKAMAMSSLCRLKSICKTVEGLKKDIEIHLDTTHKYTKGEDNGKAAATLIRLKKRYEKAMEGLGKVLYHYNIYHNPHRHFRAFPGDLSLGKPIPGDMSPGIRSSSTPIYSTGSLTPPRYSPGASTPPSYSLGTSRNAQC
ncbi:hypothetical protein Tco_1210489 [Tanacetum coccineum]